MLDKTSRFVYSCVYSDYSTDLLVGSFDTICNLVERELNKSENDKFRYKSIVIIDRDCGATFNIDNDYQMERTLYSQFVDSYFEDETI